MLTDRIHLKVEDYHHIAHLERRAHCNSHCCYFCCGCCGVAAAISLACVPIFSTSYCAGTSIKCIDKQTSLTTQLKDKVLKLRDEFDSKQHAIMRIEADIEEIRAAIDQICENIQQQEGVQAAIVEELKQKIRESESIRAKLEEILAGLPPRVQEGYVADINAEIKAAEFRIRADKGHLETAKKCKYAMCQSKEKEELRF